jgi:hypothetical protein
MSIGCRILRECPAVVLTNERVLERVVSQFGV